MVDTIQQTGKSFEEQFQEIHTILSAMGYQLVQYPEFDGSISLSGYDETENYIEMQNLNIFNVKAALDYAKRYFTVWNSLMGKQMRQAMPDFMKRFQSLSPEEQETFVAGIEQIQREALERATAEDGVAGLADGGPDAGEDETVL